MQENNNKIRVILKEPYKKPIVTYIENSLESYQSIVNGHSDCVEFPTIKNADIVCNDEFLLLRLPGNFFVPHNEGAMAGNIIVAGYNPEDGNHISLNDYQIKSALEYIETFKIPNGLDLYYDFDLLNEYMKSKLKVYDKIQPRTV